MKKLFCLIFVLIIGFGPFNKANASIFGEENATLIQILAQAIKQAYELQQIIQNGRDTFGLAQEVNRGMTDALRALDSMGPYMDAGTYKEFKKVEDIVTHMRTIYGDVTPSPNQIAQSDTDQVVAEALTLNNSLYDYAKEIDDIGEKIKRYSNEASPGVAQKLTAQSMGVLVHVMNQQIRAQATNLKLQAQGLAVQNKKEKESTTQYLKQADILGSAMKAKQLNLTFPRF